MSRMPHTGTTPAGLRCTSLNRIVGDEVFAAAVSGLDYVISFVTVLAVLVFQLAEYILLIPLSRVFFYFGYGDEPFGFAARNRGDVIACIVLFLYPVRRPRAAVMVTLAGIVFVLGHRDEPPVFGIGGGCDVFVLVPEFLLNGFCCRAGWNILFPDCCKQNYSGYWN